MKEAKNWKVEYDKLNTPILLVYQSKLTAVAPQKIWKGIPLILPEQKQTLDIIKSSQFRRPIHKVMKHYFGNSVNLYGGRKGFTDLMMSYDQSFEDISQ